MSKVPASRLTRPRQAMPTDVRQALHEAGLSKAYDDRPPYQRNDYLAWIGRAKRPETRQRRMEQMLAELKAGNAYMNMPWRARSKPRAGR